MKKVMLILSMVMVLFTNSLSYAVAEESKEDNVIVSQEAQHSNSAKQEQTTEEVTPATQKILSNTTKKDKKIAEYSDKYNDKTYAYTAYYLDIIQTYSIPVCIIGIAIGAFNFYIIGEKKLDKKEKGFSFIMAFLCGLVFFQVLPFVFALLVAGK